MPPCPGSVCSRRLSNCGAIVTVGSSRCRTSYKLSEGSTSRPPASDIILLQQTIMGVGDDVSHPFTADGHKRWECKLLVLSGEGPLMR